MNILLLTNGKSHLRSDADRWHLPEPSARHDENPKPSYGCSKPTRPERERLATVKQRKDLTHSEDLKDPGEVQLPGGNRVLITLRVDKSGGQVSSTLFGDLILDLRDSSAIKNVRQ